MPQEDVDWKVLCTRSYLSPPFYYLSLFVKTLVCQYLADFYHALCDILVNVLGRNTFCWPVMPHRRDQTKPLIPCIIKYHIVVEVVYPTYLRLIIIYFLRIHYCWRPYYHILIFVHMYAHFFRSLSPEVVWVIFYIIPMHI